MNVKNEFLMITRQYLAVNDRWPAVILSAVRLEARVCLDFQGWKSDL